MLLIFDRTWETVSASIRMCILWLGLGHDSDSTLKQSHRCIGWSPVCFSLENLVCIAGFFETRKHLVDVDLRVYFKR